MVAWPNWSDLNHAYGAADDIPRILGQLSPDENAKVWGDLWSRICHQGTVYSASFPVLPYLLEAALRWPPANRVMPLYLAAMIVISRDVEGSRERLMADHLQTVKDCRNLTVETLKAQDLGRQKRIYLMEAALAFEGDVIWGQALDGLVSGEFQGKCRHCRTHLFVVIGADGYFVTAEEWIKKLPDKRSPIAPASPADLLEAGTWLYEQAITAGDLELADWICNVFGCTTCPNCGFHQNVPDIVSALLK